jgi:hypothetical protein
MASESFELAGRASAAEAIWRMNEEDLRFLNRLIVERLKLIRYGCVTPFQVSVRKGEAGKPSLLASLGVVSSCQA